jgi:hypothetical protein
VFGWANYLGPPFEGLRPAALGRALDTAARLGLEEAVTEWWQTSWDSWRAFGEKAWRAYQEAIEWAEGDGT